MEVLTQYAVSVILAICLAVGCIIKNSLSFIPNKYIPLIMAIIGVGLNIWINGTLTPEVLLGGLASGLASTGTFEALRNLIEKDGKKVDNQDGK